jgi:hypothetical protein
MNRTVTMLAGAVAGVAAAIFLRRRLETAGRAGPAPAVDPRAEDLRRKLAEASRSVPDEDDFEAAGMGAETLVVEEPRPAGESERPPGDEFEAMRRRVHEEGRAAAEQMRRKPDADEG